MPASPIGSVTINDGAAVTASGVVTLAVPARAPDGVTAVRISNSPTTTTDGLLDRYRWAAEFLQLNGLEAAKSS